MYCAVIFLPSHLGASPFWQEIEKGPVPPIDMHMDQMMREKSRETAAAAVSVSSCDEVS